MKEMLKKQNEFIQVQGKGQYSFISEFNEKITAPTLNLSVHLSQNNHNELIFASKKDDMTKEYSPMFHLQTFGNINSGKV